MLKGIASSVSDISWVKKIASILFAFVHPWPMPSFVPRGQIIENGGSVREFQCVADRPCPRTFIRRQHLLANLNKERLDIDQIGVGRRRPPKIVKKELQPSNPSFSHSMPYCWQSLDCFQQTGPPNSVHARILVALRHSQLPSSHLATAGSRVEARNLVMPRGRPDQPSPSTTFRGSFADK